MQLPGEQALDVRRLAAALLAVLAFAGGWAATAAAQTPGSAESEAAPLLPRAPSDPNAISRPERLDARPPDHRLTGLQAQRIAARNEKVREALRKYPTAKPEVFLKGPSRWQVSWFTGGRGPNGDARKEVAQVYIDDLTGGITEAWNGPQVAWTMARGYAGAFGRKVNSPWVWIPLSVLFFAPFFDWRRPLRVLHLDLLALDAFGISVAFFNDANLDASVPIVAPLLAYLLARMLWIGLRQGTELRFQLKPLVPTMWLAVAVIFLVGFRVGLNLTSSNVIDVGYSGVIGADRLVDGTKLYNHFPKDDEHGDTYGPVAYEAYVPFEQALPWSGRWDELPAAHAAAITFDLLTLALLFGVGWRIRGPGLGVVLAYAWATWPFSLYALNCNTNDSLVAVFAALVLLVAARPVARGIAGGLGAFAKLGSLGLLPLLTTHGARRGTWLRTVVLFGIGLIITTILVWLPIVARGESLSTVYDRTVAFQAGRGAPFSIWGLYDWSGAQHVWQVVAALFALAAAFIPRRRDVIGLAAVAAAILIALQLGLTYWFYLYLVWFFPFLAVAIFGRYRIPDPA